MQVIYICRWGLYIQLKWMSIHCYFTRYMLEIWGEVNYSPYQVQERERRREEKISNKHKKILSNWVKWALPEKGPAMSLNIQIGRQPPLCLAYFCTKWTGNSDFSWLLKTMEIHAKLWADEEVGAVSVRLHEWGMRMWRTKNKYFLWKWKLIMCSSAEKTWLQTISHELKCLLYHFQNLHVTWNRGPHRSIWIWRPDLGPGFSKGPLGFTAKFLEPMNKY